MWSEQVLCLWLQLQLCTALISHVEINITLVISKTLAGININEFSQLPFELGGNYYCDKYASEN